MPSDKFFVDETADGRMRDPRIDPTRETNGARRFLIDEVRRESVLLRDSENEVSSGLRHVRKDLRGPRTGDKAENEKKGERER